MMQFASLLENAVYCASDSAEQTPHRIPCRDLLSGLVLEDLFSETKLRGYFV